MARLITEAKIGPTQGVHRRPIDKPIKTPPKKPVLFWEFGTKAESFVNSFSVKS